MPEPIIIQDDILLVPLRNKYKNIVGYAKADSEDYEKLSQYYFSKRIDETGKEYVTAALNGNSMTMHELVYGKAPDNYVIDHRNSDGLDNRKSNLRYATNSQNSQNRIKEVGKYTSDYTGVSHSIGDQLYRAGIQYKGDTIYIGRFENEIEAAKAYDIYAIHYFREGAKTNKILTEQEIENILKNGIPDEYKRTQKELPKNITYNRYGEYDCSVQRNGKRIRKYGIETLEEAIKIRDELIEEMDKEINEEKMLDIENLIDNIDNETVIYLKNKDGDIVSQTMVDEELSLKLASAKWYLTNRGYVNGYPDGNHQSIHTYLYKTYIGEIPNDMTVDHADMNPLNNKLSNLRLATPSLQIHNQKKRDDTTCHYKGVAISANKFIVTFERKKWSFDYAEDAAIKYNEVAKEKYGDAAYQNVVPNTKTNVLSYLSANKNNITVEYIKSITTVEEFKMLIRNKNWGGVKGHFKISTIKINDLEEHKKKAAELLIKEENGINVNNNLHNYKGVAIHSNKFIVTHDRQSYSYTYIEDAAKKYNEIMVEKRGELLHHSELNIVPDTKTKVSDLEIGEITIERVENIKHVADLMQIVKKKGWYGRKGPFYIKEMNKSNFENDKRKLIELLTKEKAKKSQ